MVFLAVVFASFLFLGLLLALDRPSALNLLVLVSRAMGEGYLLASLLAFILGIVAALVATWGRRLLKSPWSVHRPYWVRSHLRPGKGMKGARQLKELQSILGDISVWLGTDDIPLMKEVSVCLWKQASYLEIEVLAYWAIYSNNLEDQSWAVRQLLQMRDEPQAQEALNAIAHHPLTPKAVRRTAEDALKKP